MDEKDHLGEIVRLKERAEEERKVFGEKATPKLAVYDRGASLSAVAQGLKKAGVQKVGIPPAWTGCMDARGEGSEESQKRTGQNRRQHRPPQEPQIRLLSSAGAQRDNAGRGWPASHPVGQFAHTDERDRRTGYRGKHSAGVKDQRRVAKEQGIKRSRPPGYIAP